MRDHDYQPSVDFLKRFFAETLHKVELRACPNVRTGGAVSVFAREEEALSAFAVRRDQVGHGLYFGVCTRGDLLNDKGEISGGKDNVQECPALWVDIDCVKQGLTGDETLKALSFLPLPPSLVINSGGGLHAYWLLEEPEQVAGDYQFVESLLRRLALILAGDTSCAEIARIMRLPGSHNSKDATLAVNEGAPALVEIIEDSGRVYDLAAIAEWLEDQRAVLHSRQAPTTRPVREDDPFVAYARQAGFNPAIDIDDELAAMQHGGTGSTSIHATQLRVSASMIARNYDDDEIVTRILAATEAAAPGNERWNWSREEENIRGMIRTGRAKGYAVKSEERPAPAAAKPMAGNAAVAVVHNLNEERAKREKPKTKAESNNEITVLGGATLAAWNDRYGPIMHANGGSFLYEDGVWSEWDEVHDQMLRALLQEGCSKLKMKPATSLLNAASRFIMDNPDLLVRSVDFDSHDFIIAEDGIIDPATMEIDGHSPEHRARFKVGASLHGKRECPAFLDFLSGAFADRPGDEAAAIISTLQEWFGAALVASKPRALRKGLLVHGGSRTGKTQISEILRAILGKNQTTSIKVRDLEKDFGTQTLLGKRGWVADDAVGQDETLDAETYKVLVTGEAMSVRRKNRSMVDGFRFGRPVCLTMNNLPRIKDGSDAVYNRSLVLPMTRVRAESAPEPAGYDSIADKIIKEELTGVLWWAIEGWRRVSARGVFNPPACMVEAVRALQETNDPVGTWIRQCAVSDERSKVAPADLFASFAGWFFREYGDSKFGWSQNGFSRKLKERLPHVKPAREARKRWILGIRINEDGLEYWTANAERDANRRTTAESLDAFSVNQDNHEVPEKPTLGRTVF